MKKKSNRTALGWIYRRSRRFIPMIIAMSLLNAGIAVGYVLLALASRDVIDIATGSKSGSLVLSGISLFAIVGAQLLFSALSSIISVRSSGGLLIEMRSHLFTSLMQKKYPLVSLHHSGDLLNRFTSDIEVIDTGVNTTIPSVISLLAKLIAGITTLAVLNWRLAVIILLVGTAVPALGRVINKKFKYLHKECQRTEGESRSFMQECFENIIVIKSFISTLPFLKKLKQYMKNNLRTKITRNNISLTVNLSLYGFFTAGYYAVLLWGAGSIAAGVMTYGTLTAFLQLVSQLRGPLQSVSGIVPQYYSALASAERLMELETIEDEAAPVLGGQLEALKGEFSSIDIESLDFAYADEQILSGCTFKLERGGITAITGESGSGKSTLFKLMLGLYEPQKGKITLNGSIPVNSSTRGLFAYVPQDSMVLSGTIRENITLCDDTVSDEALGNAARAAVIYDFIMTLPDGFDTVISERGAGLSGGQLQRIAIARALLFDAPVLLLDESTSALDEETETALLSNIKKMRDKTVIFITHRNTSISVCDHIIHVEGKSFSAVK